MPSRAEIPDQVRYDEGGTYHDATEGSDNITPEKEKYHADGGGSSTSKDDEKEHTCMQRKAVMTKGQHTRIGDSSLYARNDEGAAYLYAGKGGKG